MEKKSRNSALLSAIINEYIKTAKPVSSGVIVDNYGFDCSPATIRNEMVVLEEQGYIESPHTSAGRVPTQQGWQLYIAEFLENEDISSEEQVELKKDLKLDNLKNTAKKLGNISELTVFIGFSEHDTYFTGLANLFKQPEFQEIDLVQSISQVVEHLEEMMPKIKKVLNNETKVLIGAENPFGADSGVVATEINKVLVGILGPVRMDYQKNIARLNFIKELLI